MNKIQSASITIKQKLSMKKILDIYQAAKKYEGSIYLYSKEKIANVTNMPKLVSFLLTIKTDSSIKVISQGKDPYPALSEITKIMTPGKTHYLSAN